MDITVNSKQNLFKPINSRDIDDLEDPSHGNSLFKFFENQVKEKVRREIMERTGTNIEVSPFDIKPE